MAVEAFDLEKLSKLLASDRRYVEQVRLLEEFSSACSIMADLYSARASLISILENDHDELARVKFGQALMMHAVISYSRALISRTNNRRRIDIPGKAFTKEQRVKHEGIADLRSTALAHYHQPLGPYAAEWVNDKIVVKARDGVFDTPQDTFVRVNYRKEAVDDLFELMQAALSYLDKERDIRAEALRKSLEASAQDDTFRTKLLECSFVPESFYQSAKAAQNFWDEKFFVGEEYTPRSADDGSEG